MKGDFSRGHRPDQKRGEKYRRVLLQQGRLVLDSDVAASVDAVDGLVRDLAADVGCPSGSPDMGYLVTAGPLIALFDERQSFVVEPPIPLFKAYRDYGAKFGPEGQERFPSLYVGATEAAGSVLIRSRFALQADDPLQVEDYFPTIRVWARIAPTATLEIVVGGATTSILGLDGTTFLPYDIDLAALSVTAYDDISVGFSVVSPDHEAWIGLVEGYQVAAQEPRFWITGGRYYLDGLEVELDPTGADGQYPEVTFPAAAGFDNPDLALAPSTHVVAYLEGWERLITHVEDAGILEQALGGALDTTVRTAALGQVKLAYFSGGGLVIDPTTDDPAILGAFTAVDAGTAALDVTTTPTVANPDPCAVPEAGGYTGPDNRLYRFEVHGGGDLGVTSLKWSKNNGADLFAAVVDNEPMGLVSLPSGADVRDGDLVELIAEDDDLGDAAPALITLATPSFRPADRRVGTLYYARTTSKTGQIQLLYLATKTTASLVAGTGARPGIKVRRWHGLLRTDPVSGSPVTSFELGDGITIELSGASFRPGDYWQYEARKLRDNANGAWQSSPHGPERIFAPLALLRWGSAALPIALRRWYDDRFSAICELEADDIAYDGDKVGTTADTVQEAIDELYSRVDEGACCDVEIEPGPSGSDDGVRIQEAIDGKLPLGGKLCLRRGVYTIESTITIADKRVVIAGCPGATLVHAAGAAPMFEVDDGGDLVLESLDLFAPGPGAAGPLVLFPPSSLVLGDGEEGGVLHEPPRLTAREVGLIHVGTGGIAVQDAGMVPVPLDPDADDPWAPMPYATSQWPLVDIERCVIVAPWAIAGGDLQSLTIRDSIVVFAGAAVYSTYLDAIAVTGTQMTATLDGSLIGELSAADPATLADTLKEALEASRYNPIETGSIGIVARHVWGGRFDESVISADVAWLVAYAYQITSTLNHYWGAVGPAIRTDTLQYASFRADEIRGKPAGLHARAYVYELSVEACVVQGALGIVLGAGRGGVVYPPGGGGGEGVETGVSLVRVRIVNNKLFGGERSYVPIGVTIGVLLGPAELSSAGGGGGGPFVVAFGYLTDVVVEGNTFGDDAPDICIMSTFRDVALYYESSGPQHGLRILGNRIHGGFLGIVVFSSAAEIKDNTIQRAVSSEGPIPTGAPDPLPNGCILVMDGAEVVIADNVIRLDPPSYGEDFTAEAAGIIIQSGSLSEANLGGQICGNTVRCGTGKPIIVSLEGGSYDRLTVDDNLLEGSACKIGGVGRIVVRDNRVRGEFIIDQSHDGLVSGNVVEYGPIPGTYPALDVTRAFGQWQIEDNRSEGHIRLFPDYTSYYGMYYGFTHELLAPMLRGGAASRPKIDEIVAGLARETPEEAKPPAGKVAKPRPAPKLSHKKAALYADEVVLSIAAAKLEKILTRVPLAGAGPDYSIEFAYDALVSGNWAREHLLVGYYAESVSTPIASYPGVFADYEGSNIQILGNRAGYLIHNSYRQLIVSHNMAVDFTPGGGETTTLTDRNYDLP